MRAQSTATLPTPVTVTNGVATFNVKYNRTGNQTLTITHSQASNITATSAAVTVGAGQAASFQVSVAANTTAGVSTQATVTAVDSNGATATGYAGTFAFTSSDSAAVLGGSLTLTNGQGSFPVTFKTSGARTLTATDNATPSITGVANTTVGAGAFAGYGIFLNVTGSAAYGTYVVNFLRLN